jgi:hypothetical protein
MIAAMRRYLDGKRTRLPFRVQVHMVATLYGQTPAAVRDWPADDFMDALNFREVTDVGKHG